MRFLVVAIFLLLPGPLVQAFPERPLVLVLPYPATGSPDIDGTSRVTKLSRTLQTFASPRLTDVLALDLTQLLAATLGKQVSFERHPTGNTIEGAEYVARARPDGHTLLFVGSPTMTILPGLHARTRFNPRKELAPVASYASMPLVLIASRRNSASTVQQMIARSKQARVRIDYAALGDGSTAHLAGELFRSLSGVELIHVNYNGAVAAVNAVITRDVDFAFVPLPSALAFSRSEGIRIIAVSSPTRHSSIAHVPTVGESGIQAFDAQSWFGVFTAAGTPEPVVAQLNAAVRTILAEDLTRRTLIGLGLTPASATLGEFRALIDRDAERWTRLLQDAASRQ